MTAFDRRSLLAATAAAVAATSVGEARECSKTYDWETMSLEDRNLAFNNVAHVAPEFAQKKTRSGLRLQQNFASNAPNTSIWLTVQESGTSGTCTQHPTLTHPVSFISMVDTGSAAVRKYSAVFLRVL